MSKNPKHKRTRDGRWGRRGRKLLKLGQRLQPLAQLTVACVTIYRLLKGD